MNKIYGIALQAKKISKKIAYVGAIINWLADSFSRFPTFTDTDSDGPTSPSEPVK